MPTPRQTAAALAAVAALGLTACAAPAPATGTDADRTGLTVFAAASLKGSFDTLARDFEAEHPGVDVRYSYDGSSTLVDQLAAGAPADVLATADEKTMKRATSGGLVTAEPTVFATNVLALVVPTGNPAKITGLDASLSGKKLVVCATGVPCGTATDQLAAKLGVTLTPVSREQNVTAVLGKVTSGEADAGVVYRTDAKAAGAAVETVAVAGAEAVVNRYPVAITASAKQPALAQQFVAYLTSERGESVLGQYGFGRP